jgi:glycosyltransferase involved in cell wall biosynthesis
MPKVSVIIPTYNYARFIGQAIQSVLVQSYQDFEVIVVDDGSSDNTAEVVGGFGSQVRYLRQENRGANATRNAGIKAARGEFIAFLDADDLWMPEKLALQIRLSEARSEAGLIYGGMLLFDSTSGAVIGYHPLSRCHEGWVMRQLYMYQFVPSPTPLIRREVFERVGAFDEGVTGPDDWDMWLRIAARFQFALVAEPVALYRVHASVAGSKSVDQYAAEMITFFERMALRYPADLEDLKRRRLSIFKRQIGCRFLRQGNLASGRRWLRAAIKSWPWEWLNYWTLISTFFGPERSIAITQQSYIDYLKGRQCLSRGELIEARRFFIRSVRTNPWEKSNAYLGILLSLVGKRLASRVMKNRFTDGKNNVSDNLEVGLQF